MIGEEDVLNDRNCTTTVKCISTHAEVFCIKAEEFMIKLGRDDKTWKTITNRVISKDEETKMKIKKAAQSQHPNYINHIQQMQNESSMEMPQPNRPLSNNPTPRKDEAYDKLSREEPNPALSLDNYAAE